MKNETRIRFVLGLLVLSGLAASLYYFSWWVEDDRILSPLLAGLLAAAAIYHWTQLLSSWVIYLAVRPAAPVSRLPVDRSPTVDVFVTACGEEPELVERALRAARDMRGEHRTWLLDDGADRRLENLAARLGVEYFARETRQDAKAGNLNAALARTEGEIVVIFDIDHVPQPEFLERSLAHFVDPEIGFVQVMLTFSNEGQGWIARAASESCYDFFNPSSRGMDRLGSATMIGTNALIRRRALQSIGGYRPGLAEDLATSIALHAAGWKSAYVAEPLAPGLAPPDLAAWFTQQLKWARGVFEVLLTDYPRFFPRLTWGQRLSYGVRMTYYWAGLVSAVHIVFTAGILIGGERVAVVDFKQYVLHLFPLVATAFVIRCYAFRCWRHPTVPAGVQWRAGMLIHTTWPIYSLAWILSVLRIPLGFRETPKRVTLKRQWNWLAPQVIATCLLIAAVVVGLTYSQTSHLRLLIAFAGVQAMPQLVTLALGTRAPLRVEDA